MIQSTKVKLPKAPTVRPIIDISKFNVGHDFANLNTLNWKSHVRKIVEGVFLFIFLCSRLISWKHFLVHVFISLQLTNLNERNTDKPCTPSKPNSSNDNATIMKSKMFQPSWK